MQAKLTHILGAIALLLVTSSPVWALAVGANWDIHMDVGGPGGPPATDFHIEGRIESGLPGGNWSDPPVLIHQVNDLFPAEGFTCTITPDTTRPSQNWYVFKADWRGGQVMFCQILHLGLLFDVTCHNLIIDLVGWWTFNDQPIPPIPVPPNNGGSVPLLGFEVHDNDPAAPQTMVLRNDSHLRDPGFAVEGVGVRVLRLEAAILSPEEMQENFGSVERAFEELRLGGAQEQLLWVAAMEPNGVPISPDNPMRLMPDSFFDILLGADPGPDSFFDVWFEIAIPPRNFFIVRQLVEYDNNVGEPDFRWSWEVHQAHDPVDPEPMADLGDAPDSTNSHPPQMTAYPIGGPPGVTANFPTVYGAGSPPHGPLHRQPRAVAWLGQRVTLENEADIGPDEDPVNNIDPTIDKPNQDLGDDGVQMPIALPHCQQTSFQYTVNMQPIATVPQLFVNVWFDFDRNGDWDGDHRCPNPTAVIPVPEWAVQNHPLPALGPGPHTLTTPMFWCWNPPATDIVPPEHIWMRITLSEQPWDPAAGDVGNGGSGPPGGYELGETEDYYFKPKDGPIQPSNPILRVGDWLNPEPWHNWIPPSDEPTEVQLLVSDPCNLIDNVLFLASANGGQTWDAFDEDFNGDDVQEDTQGDDSPTPDDGWMGHLHTLNLPSPGGPVPILVRAQAFSAAGLLLVEAEAERVLDPTPPDSVAINIEDFQVVRTEELMVDLDPILANIDRISIYIEPKEEEFKKGIPLISQQPHSTVHCAPTAAAACLKYFENQGDGQIGGGLTDHQLVDALAALAGTTSSGTTPSNLANALKKWVSDHGDGYTVRGPKNYDWKEMRDELERCQDVLTGIYWQGGGGHRMTFNSIVNRPLADGTIRVDFMDPWTGKIEYGNLNPLTGWLSNFASYGGNGRLDNIIYVCPREDDPGGPGDPHPGPDPGVIPIPLPNPGLYFLHVTVLDHDMHAHRLIRVVDYQPAYKPKPATPHIKWSQPPIEIDPKRAVPTYCGWDEPSFSGQVDLPDGTTVMRTRSAADDFRCLGDMPITSIHWWGSYVGWQATKPPSRRPVRWRIGFWDNVPADSAGVDSYSHPGKLLHMVEVSADRVRHEWVGYDWFPDMPHDTCFQYNLDLKDDEWFQQAEYNSPDDVFWLSITAVYEYEPDTRLENVWGWKTRPEHWMDDAVAFVFDGSLEPGTVPGKDTFIPLHNDNVCGPESYDLAFELDTDPKFIKWEQPFTGIRRWPHYEDEESIAVERDTLDIIRLVADDWRCERKTPITAISWWGSYISYHYQACECNDEISPRIKPDYFLLSIWKDVPAGTTLPYSHPGEKVWDYRAFEYNEVMVGFDKHPHDATQQPGFEPVFRYSVKIPEDEQFMQENVNGIYWLSVVAVFRNPDTVIYPWGWTNHDHKPWGVPGMTPVGHWRFDELTGRIAADSSPNGNDATLQGGYSWQPLGGMLNGALDLDGTGSGRTANVTTGLDFAPGSFTVSAWVNGRTVAGGWRTIAEYDRDGRLDNSFGMWLSATGNFHFRVGLDTMNSTVVLNPNQWYLLTGVYDATTSKMKVYIDGNPDGVANHANGYGAPAAKKLTIGVRGWEDAEYFDGMLDDLRIYASAMSDAQVGSLLTIGRNDDAVAGYTEPGDPTNRIIRWEEQFDQTGESEDMSFTLFTKPTKCGDFWNPYPIGDYNPDCRINFRDLAIIVLGWDGVYNMQALVEIADNWLECTDPAGCP